MSDFLLDSKSGWVGYKHEVTHTPPSKSVFMHAHDRYEFIYFLCGDATHVIEGRRYKLTPGDLILLHPMNYHFIQIDSSATYERFIVGFDEALMGEPLSELLEGLPEVINISREPNVEQIFDKMRFCSHFHTHFFKYFPNFR